MLEKNNYLHIFLTERKPLLLPFFSTTEKAKAWCEDTVCPTNKTVKMTDCCVHHVNVHSCPKEEGGLCGPWLKHDGSTYTHSAVIGIICLK